MKYLITFFLIVIMLVTAWFFRENIRLKKLVEKQQMELDISSKYIKKINQKISEHSDKNFTLKPSAERVNALIDNYLNEKKDNKLTADKELIPEQISYIPDIIPLKGEFAISQKFSDKHTGIDLASPSGSEIVAVATGEVLSVYYDEHYGKVIMIDHLNQFTTLYAHLATSFFEANDSVKKGETIALVGNTGYSSAPHLHFELLIDGKSVDPLDHINLLK
ncbi:MAG: M23 family metallopeptidase [Candidatus Cloacimonetes bacterium]|nr:M23 family metallopeptidase [Candidatus Cloacimonadota bacterium]